MNVTKTICGMAAVLLAAASVNAAVVSTANFDAPTYSDGLLNSNTDTTTAGQDGWLNTSAGGATVTNGIAVSNSATNGYVSLTTSGQDVRKLFDGGASATPGNNSVYLSAIINVSAAQSAGDYFIHLGDGGASNFYARTYIKSSGAGFVMALGTGAGTANYGTTVLNLNTSYNLLVRLDLASGTANDSGALFINPISADGSTDTAYVAATTIGTDASSISSFSLRQGSAANSATLTVDNISVSTGALVPEPASLALIGLGGLAALRRRRA